MTKDIFYKKDVEGVKVLDKINVHLYGNSEENDVGLFGEMREDGGLTLILDANGEFRKNIYFSDRGEVFDIISTINVPLSDEELKKYKLEEKVK